MSINRSITDTHRVIGTLPTGEKIEANLSVEVEITDDVSRASALAKSRGASVAEVVKLGLSDFVAKRHVTSKPGCPQCDGTGMRDSGGVHPWGEPIFIPCDCREETGKSE